MTATVTHKRTRRIYWVGSMPDTHAHGQRRGDPQVRLAAAVLLRAVADLRWMQAGRARTRGEKRAKLDAQAREIVQWMCDESCWATRLAGMEADASRRFLATLPADWRTRDGPEDTRCG